MEHIEAEEILRSGDFDCFLKATESATFDCKGSPYQLDNSNQEQELAKDIAGFANASGGIIIIGLSTIRPTSLFLEEVHEVRPFSKDLIDPKQYTDVLKERIYPNPNVEPRWWPSACDPSKGLFAIQVYASDIPKPTVPRNPLHR
jgi:Putative DNA-binding domain